MIFIQTPNGKRFTYDREESIKCYPKQLLGWLRFKFRLIPWPINKPL